MFVVMIGYGLTLPVLPFYIQRMAMSKGASTFEAILQVGILTGIFSLMQFFFAPLWGKLTDSLGRRPLFLTGLLGYTFSMLFFAVGTNLFMLYTARIIGGILSAAVLPISGAAVADMTSEKDRGRGMAWLGTARGMGVVVGPAMGAFLSRSDFHVAFRFWHFRIDGFSIPFFAAAVLALLALVTAMRWLPETLKLPGRHSTAQWFYFKNMLEPGFVRRIIPRRLVLFMVLAFLSYFALALFEGTFALHAKLQGQFGPTEMGWVFTMCGIVMAATQGTLVAYFMEHFDEKLLLAPGFILMCTGLVLLMTSQNIIFVLLYVALFAFGVALITPSLAALVSKQAGQSAGAAMGKLSAANNLGQASGPAVGGLLFNYHIHAPYLLTALLLGAAAIFLLFTMFGQSDHYGSRNPAAAERDQSW